MPAPDYIDFDAADDEPSETTCNRCQAGEGLYWQEVFGPTGTACFKLFEGSKPHVCKPNADDFDVVGG